MSSNPITRQRSPWEYVDEIRLPGSDQRAVFYARLVGDGTLRSLVALEPAGWHLLPLDVEFAMFLPKAEEYVALHETTFHLHQHPAVGS